MHGRTERPILIADDDSAFREGMATLFERDGYHVAVASDGAVALEHLRNGLDPAVIVVDLVMPHMDGLSFRAAQLRDARLARIPTVAFSNDESLRKEAETAGLKFFAKGDFASVLDHVRTLFAESPSSTSVHAGVRA